MTISSHSLTLVSTPSAVAHHPLMGTALKTLLLRGLGPLSAFLLTLLLARTLGAAAIGAFYLTITVLAFCIILAKFGLDTALQRFVGSAAEQGDWNKVILIYRQARRTSLLLSTLLTALFITLSVTVGDQLLNESYRELMLMAGLSLIPFAWFGIQSAMLKAIGQAAWGGFFEMAALPIFTIVLISVSQIFTPLSLFSLATCYLGATILTALLATWLLHQHLPNSRSETAISSPRLFAVCLPLTMVELLNYAMLWMPLLLLGLLVSESAAGIYNVSHRLATQLGLLLLVFSSITAPRFATYHQSRDNLQLAQLAGRSTRIMCMLGLIPATILLLGAEPILGLFGEEFIHAKNILQILVIGQWVNLMTGPTGNLLAMTGNERTLRNVLIISLLLMLILAGTLIPLFGALGAAWATTTPIIFHKLVCSLLVKQRLGLPFILLLATGRDRRAS